MLELVHFERDVELVKDNYSISEAAYNARW